MNKDKKFSFIRYSNCWEDTDILLDALNIGENETGLSIASAGDNTLAMLIKNPVRVYAFDINKTQLYCLELKIACFKNLTYEETLSFLGVGRCDRISVYKRLEGSLTPEARRYFEKNMKLIKKGIIHTGKFESFFWVFRNFVIPVVCGQKKFSAFAKTDDIDAQWAFYKKHIDNRRLKFLFGIFFGYKVLGALGRDKDFYKYVDEKEKSGSDLKKRFEYGIKNTSNATNPYLSYIADGNYSPRSLPLYLREENYEIIRKNADRIIPVHGDLMSVDAEKFDFVNLSDIFEYMSEEDFAKNTDFLLSAVNDGARVAYWNMQNKRYITANGFEYDTEKSQRLFVRNKSWFYRDFRIYRKAETNE